MNRYLSIFFALIFMTPMTSIADGHGNYVEFSILDSSWDSGVSNVSGATLDEDDTGFAITGGMPLNANLDLEYGYADFGEASLSGSSGNTFDYRSTSYTFNATGSIKLEGDAFFIGLKPKMSLTDSITAYARLGYNMWDTTLTVSTSTASADVSADGNDLYYGFGVSGNMGGLNISLSHSNYEFDSDDVDSTALSVSVNF
jgi:hypothetical protein